MSSLKLKNSLGEWQSLPVIKGDVGNILYGTATGTNDYSVDFVVAPELIAGLVLNIKVQNANTSSTVTLNINSTGSKPIYRNGNQQLEINTIKAGQVICVIYDGVLFQLLSDSDVMLISNDSITNDKLVSDIKIGSLSSLNTTEKASVVGAINEVDANLNLVELSVQGITNILSGSSRGYFKDSATGLILQWDSVTPNSAESVSNTVKFKTISTTFPIAFPTICLHVIATGWRGNIAYTQAITKTGCTIGHVSVAGAFEDQPVRYLAIGY